MTQSLDFPTDSNIFMYKGFKVPTLSYWLGGYQINASTLLFFVGFQVSFFGFLPKKYWYQNVRIDIVVQWGLLACVRSRVQTVLNV